MFPSVKDRARQLFGEAAFSADGPPSPPVATGRKGAPPPKAASATKATPEPKTPVKGSRAAAQAKKDAAPKVEETPKPVGAWPSPLEQFKARSSPLAKTSTTPTSAKTTSSAKAAAALKAAAPSKPSSPTSSKPEKPSKSEKPEKSSREKSEKSEKKSHKSSDKDRESKKSSRPKTPPTPKAAAPSGGLFSRKAPEPKPAAPPKKSSSSSKPTIEPKKEKPSRPTLSTRTSSRPKIERSSSSSSLDSDADPDDLRAACLREASKVTGLKGKELAISLRQRSSGGWYAALKDVGADKYLKMWMNRDKTFATQEEALQAYLVFVKKMNSDMKLFGPMSPKSGKTKGFF